MLGAGLVVSILLGGLIHLTFARLISHQESRNAFLEAQIDILDKKIEEIKMLESQKEQLLARIETIQKLQLSRTINVRMFDAIVDRLPDGVGLEEFDQSANKLRFTGLAQSNARVSSFMRSLEEAPVMSSPVLSLIEAQNKNDPRAPGALNKFVVSMTLSGDATVETAQ